MTRADHRREPFFALFWPRRGGGERPNAASSGESEGGFGRRLLSLYEGVVAVGLGNAGNRKRGSDAPAAETARRHAAGLGERKSGIVDVTGLRQPVAKVIESRVARAGPAALAKLSLEVEEELAAGRREPRDIGQRHLAQRRLVDRGRRAALSSGLRHALFVPRFPTITKRRTRASVALVQGWAA